MRELLFLIVNAAAGLVAVVLSVEDPTPEEMRAEVYRRAYDNLSSRPHAARSRPYSS